MTRVKNTITILLAVLFLLLFTTSAVSAGLPTSSILKDIKTSLLASDDSITLTRDSEVIVDNSDTTDDSITLTRDSEVIVDNSGTPDDSITLTRNSEVVMDNSDTTDDSITLTRDSEVIVDSSDSMDDSITLTRDSEMVMDGSDDTTGRKATSSTTDTQPIRHDYKGSW
jgi:hypothetical protein